MANNNYSSYHFILSPDPSLGIRYQLFFIIKPAQSLFHVLVMHIFLDVSIFYYIRKKKSGLRKPYFLTPREFYLFMMPIPKLD